MNACFCDPLFFYFVALDYEISIKQVHEQTGEFQAEALRDIDIVERHSRQAETRQLNDRVVGSANSMLPLACHAVMRPSRAYGTG